MQTQVLEELLSSSARATRIWREGGTGSRGSKEEGGDRGRGALQEDGALREGEGEIERGGSSRALPGSMHACVGGGGGEREGLRGRAARVRRVRWAGAGWLGPRGRLGCKAALSLSRPHISFNRKEIREKKRKEGLGKGFVQGAIFPDS